MDFFYLVIYNFVRAPLKLLAIPRGLNEYDVYFLMEG